ncbi:MAG TPA: hypothetical protein VIL20_26790 [Sandaracinaceae bacterium]
MREARLRAAGADEAVLFFCVEGAPREACRTLGLPDGGLRFDTVLHGIVVGSEPGELHVEHGRRRVTVRYLLPSAIDLAALVGHPLHARVSQQYLGRGRATIDAELRDPAGRLLLWARDGRMPADRSAHGLALRLTVADAYHRLAVGHAGGLASLRAPDLARVRIGADRYAFVLVRAEADDVAFALVRS